MLGPQCIPVDLAAVVVCKQCGQIIFEVVFELENIIEFAFEFEFLLSYFQKTFVFFLIADSVQVLKDSKRDFVSEI